MNNILLNLRGKLDPQMLRLLRGAADVAAQQSIEFFVVGASARDLILEHGYGLPSRRATMDVDLAIAISDWLSYERFFTAMANAGIVNPIKGIAHKYQVRGSSLTVDIVPFGAIEHPVGTIAWPPEFEIRMTVTGFRDAHACALRVALDDALMIGVASLHGLAFLKLLAWRERSFETQRDGIDLDFIIRQYGTPVMQARLLGEAFEVLEHENFDTLAAGARLLGIDMGCAMSTPTRNAVCATLDHEMTDASGLRLAQLLAGGQTDDAAIDAAIAQIKRIRDGTDEAAAGGAWASDSWRY